MRTKFAKRLFDYLIQRFCRVHRDPEEITKMAIYRTVTRYVQCCQLICGKVWVVTKHAGRVALRIVIDDQHSEPSQRKVDTKVY
ncbi:hypothetical protein D3C81_2021050 [compost metagenome]